MKVFQGYFMYSVVSDRLREAIYNKYSPKKIGRLFPSDSGLTFSLRPFVHLSHDIH